MARGRIAGLVLVVSVVVALLLLDLRRVAAAAAPADAPRHNVLLIAVDDLRPRFGSAAHLYAVPEVKAPRLEAFVADRGATVFRNAYVQIAVCGPSRSSMLTSRRPDTTQVGVGRGGGKGTAGAWCWCRRTSCHNSSLFMTLPTYFRDVGGYATAGVGKIFHPDACNGMAPIFKGVFSHKAGDDPRAWSSGYGVEANFSQEQWGSIPGPHDPVFDFRMGLSYNESDLDDGQQTDGLLAADAIAKLAGFRAAGIGISASADDNALTTPFFLAVGFHKPHLPHIVPQKYFDMSPLENISVPPNPLPPKGFLEHNWHGPGSAEIQSYNLNAGPEFRREGFAFQHPIEDDYARRLRRGYFAATSFVDAQIGKVLDALDAQGFADSTIVVVWSDHGWHLGDVNAWGKMTNYEEATNNVLIAKVPGMHGPSTTDRIVESVDLFPTLVELASLPALAVCKGRDQPPTTQCVQGTSFASEFDSRRGDAAEGRKQYAFHQWPCAAWPEGNTTLGYRMGDAVRSATHRLVEYVPYDDVVRFVGNWTEDPARPPHDLELYDLVVDPHETTNAAGLPENAALVRALRAALRAQFSDGE